MRSAPRVHAYCLLIPHPDVSDAPSLGLQGDFNHWDAYDAKHELHILGTKNRGINARVSGHAFPSQKLKGKSHVHLRLSHCQRSPRLPDGTWAPQDSVGAFYCREVIRTWVFRACAITVAPDTCSSLLSLRFAKLLSDISHRKVQYTPAVGSKLTRSCLPKGTQKKPKYQLWISSSD